MLSLLYIPSMAFAKAMFQTCQLVFQFSLMLVSCAAIRHYGASKWMERVDIREANSRRAKVLEYAIPRVLLLQQFSASRFQCSVLVQFWPLDANKLSRGEQILCWNDSMFIGFASLFSSFCYIDTVVHSARVSSFNKWVVVCDHSKGISLHLFFYTTK